MKMVKQCRIESYRYPFSLYTDGKIQDINFKVPPASPAHLYSVVLKHSADPPNFFLILCRHPRVWLSLLLKKVSTFARDPAENYQNLTEFMTWLPI